MSCRRCVRALSCGMVVVMDENINENGQKIHGSLSGLSRTVQTLVRDLETPISEWTEPSLIVLRAVELAQASRSDLVYGFSSQQVSPIISISDWACTSSKFLGSTRDSIVVACLMEFAGGRIEEGISHGQLFAPIGACIRFPDNELVRDIARKRGSVAQAELDRREDEERQRWW